MPATGNGATLTLATSSMPAAITSITFGGFSRESLDTSTLSTTGARTFIPADLVDNGDFSVEGYWDGTTLPISAAAETMTIAIGTTAGTKSFAGSAFCTSAEYGAPMDDLVSFSATFKWAGAVTIS